VLFCGNASKENARIKLIDFGLSLRESNNNSEIQGWRGTPAYLPAEMFLGKKVVKSKVNIAMFNLDIDYSKETEVFTVGCLMVELYIRKTIDFK
jgi:serine/threonine protein kinase